MSGLGVQDVDDLRDWWDGEREGDSAGSMLGRLDAVVAVIAARHVTAALNEAADAIERELICCDVFERLHEKYASEHAEDEKRERRFHAICYWGEASARIVRAAIPTDSAIAGAP